MLQASGITESDLKAVIKKQLENASKRKDGEKTHFLRLNIRSSRIHFQLRSSVQIFKV